MVGLETQICLQRCGATQKQSITSVEATHMYISNEMATAIR